MTKANPFADLTFDDFRARATDPSLSRHEKVGFPDSYRENLEGEIFRDVVSKLPVLQAAGRKVLEIGPGCSNLPVMLSQLCERQGHELALVDSAEMLAHLPDAPHVWKCPGRFPDTPQLLERWHGKADVIIAYSVIQYVFAEGNLWDFLDRCLILLAEGGEILFGDVPNVAMRKRFFSSAAGVRFHQEYTGTSELPDVTFNRPEPGQIDDSVVLALLHRARAQGCHAWVVPQSQALPMANRREDVLIRKP